MIIIADIIGVNTNNNATTAVAANIFVDSKNNNNSSSSSSSNGGLTLRTALHKKACVVVYATAGRSSRHRRAPPRSYSFYFFRNNSALEYSPAAKWQGSLVTSPAIGTPLCSVRLRRQWRHWSDVLLAFVYKLLLLLQVRRFWPSTAMMARIISPVNSFWRQQFFVFVFIYYHQR